MRKTRRAIIPKLMKRLKDYSACFVKKMKDSLVFAKRTLKKMPSMLLAKLKRATCSKVGRKTTHKMSRRK